MNHLSATVLGVISQISLWGKLIWSFLFKNPQQLICIHTFNCDCVDMFGYTWVFVDLFGYTCVCAPNAIECYITYGSVSMLFSFATKFCGMYPFCPVNRDSAMYHSGSSLRNTHIYTYQDSVLNHTKMSTGKPWLWSKPTSSSFQLLKSQQCLDNRHRVSVCFNIGFAYVFRIFIFSPFSNPRSSLWHGSYL